MGLGNDGHWLWDLEKLRANRGGGQILGLEGTPKKKHETCRKFLIYKIIVKGGIWIFIFNVIISPREDIHYSFQ